MGLSRLGTEGVLAGKELLGLEVELPGLRTPVIE
jgi:hypothetical protein